MVRSAVALLVSGLCLSGCGGSDPVAPPPPFVEIPPKPPPINYFATVTSATLSVEGVEPPQPGQPIVVRAGSTSVIAVELESPDTKLLPALTLGQVKPRQGKLIAYNMCSPKVKSRTPTKLIAKASMQFRGPPGDYSLGLVNGELGYFALTPIRVVDEAPKH